MHQSYQFVEPIKPDPSLRPTPCQVFNYVKMNLKDYDGRLQSLIHDEQGSKERAQIGHSVLNGWIEAGLPIQATMDWIGS